MVEWLNGWMVIWLLADCSADRYLGCQTALLAESWADRNDTVLLSTLIFKVQGKTVLRVWRGNSIQVIRRFYLKSFQEFKSISVGKVILLEK